MNYLLIETQISFERHLKDIERSSYISIDTESNSLYSYYEKLCLLQIACESGIYLIDTLSVNIRPFENIFKNEKVEKIFHSAESDISLIKTICNVKFSNIFDVMLAAKYSGIYRCGLGNLIKRYFSVSINKTYQKANWGARPFKKEMLDYAALDVYYLKKLRDIFYSELKNKNLLAEFLEHCASLSEVEAKKNFFDPYGYLKINGSKKLPQPNLNILKELYLKREEVAKNLNIPAFKVISNETIFKIALNFNGALKNLRSFKGITEYVFKKHSSWIVEAIKNGIKAKVEKVDVEIKETKEATHQVNPYEKYQQRFEKLKKWRAEKAKTRNLFPELILTNDILWRIAHIEEPSLENLKKYGVNDYKINMYGNELISILSE